MSFMLLFFLQLLTTLVAAVFAKGLPNRHVSVAALGFIAFLAPLILSSRVQTQYLQRHTLLLGVLTLIFRGFLPNFGPNSRVIFAALGLACELSFFSVWFSHKNEKLKYFRVALDDTNAASLGVSLAWAVIMSVLLRTIGHSVDVSMDPTGAWQLIGWALVVIAAMLMFSISGYNEPQPPIMGVAPVGSTGAVIGDIDPCTALSSSAARQPTYMAVSEESGEGILAPPPSEDDMPQMGGQTLLFLGWLCLLILVYTCFESPFVLARWADTSYIAVNIMVVVMAALFIGASVMYPSMYRDISGTTFVIMNILFMVALLFSTLAPIAKNDHWHTAQSFFVFLLIALSPLVYLQFSQLSSTICWVETAHSKRSGSLTLASLCMAVFILLALMTVSSSYVGVWAFRNLFWLVLLLVTLCSSTAVMYSVQHMEDFTEYMDTRARAIPVGLVNRALRVGVIIMLFALLLSTVLVAVLIMPSPSHKVPSDADGGATFSRSFLNAPPPGRVFSVITYDVMQGFSQQADFRFHRLARDLRRLDPDIIAFQEGETARISSGNTDLGFFLTSHLNMHSYNGPKPTVGAYGLSFLSRFPIDEATTHYFSSRREQIACVDAVIRVAEHQYVRLLVTHLGHRLREDDQIQHIRSIADLLKNRQTKHRTNASILVCDCDFTPLSAPYNATAEFFDDAWAAKHGIEGGFTYDAIHPSRRVDYVWLGSGVRARRVEVLSDVINSDHLPVASALQIQQRRVASVAATP